MSQRRAQQSGSCPVSYTHLLVEGGYTENTPAAIVYKATWEDEKSFLCTVGTLAETAEENHITKTALILVGDVIGARNYQRSKLYDPSFTTEYRLSLIHIFLRRER